MEDVEEIVTFSSEALVHHFYFFPLFQTFRYRDVLPYDQTRVILEKKTLETDYINANLVRMDDVKRKYILCQGPLENTVGHMWLMAWEQNSKAILMLVIRTTGFNVISS